MSPTLVVGITLLFSLIRDLSVDTPLQLWLVEKLLCSIVLLSVATLHCENLLVSTLSIAFRLVSERSFPAVDPFGACLLVAFPILLFSFLILLITDPICK